jgi:fimbrial isopeptide formation D2 family protein
MAKLWRRISVLALCVAAATVMCIIPAFADSIPSGKMGSANHTVTIKTDVKTPHTFEAVQVFTGTLSGDSLTNIQWGKDVDGAAILAEAAKNKDFQGAATVSALAKSIRENNVEDFASIASLHVKSVTAQAESKDGSVQFSVPDGYYLIRSKESEKTFKPFLIWVKGSDVTAAAKPSYPSVTKQVQNDFFTTDGSWTADGTTQRAHFDVGFTIPDTTGYTSFTYKLHDKMSEGLKFDAKSLKIKGLDAKYYTVTTGTGTDTFTVSVNVIQAVNDGAVLKGQSMHMTYDGIVQPFKAYKKDLTQTNKVNLEYSDNPSIVHTTTTDDITVKVIIPVIELHKVDAKTNKALGGAVFELGKSGSAVPVKKIKDGVYSVSKSGSGRMITGKDGNITLIGVPLAKESEPLKLTEVSAPKGYHKTSESVPFWFEGSGKPAESVRLCTTGSPEGLLVKDWKTTGSNKYMESKDASFTVTLFNTPEVGTTPTSSTSKTGGGSSVGGIGSVIPKTGDDLCRFIAMLIIFAASAGLLVAMGRRKKAANRK